jgi:hypothetical protein
MTAQFQTRNFGTFSGNASDTNVGDSLLNPFALFWNFGDLNVKFTEYVVAPTGHYDVNNVINVGRNDWAFDTQLGVLVPQGDWHRGVGAAGTDGQRDQPGDRARRPGLLVRAGRRRQRLGRDLRPVHGRIVRPRPGPCCGCPNRPRTSSSSC